MYSLAWDSRKHYQLTLDEQDPHYTYENISTNKHVPIENKFSFGTYSFLM